MPATKAAIWPLSSCAESSVSTPMRGRFPAASAATGHAAVCGAVRNEDHRRPAARQEKPAALGAAGSSRSTQRRVLIAPISPALASSAWHQHAVDHVNNAVRLEHVLNRDPGGIA